MRNLLHRTLLPAALLLVGAGAIAAPPAEDQMSKDPATEAMPANTTQTTSATKAEFDARDANRDGYIDKQEAAIDKKLLSQFNTLDSNKDGKLSITEFMSAKGLAKLSTKSDGNIDRQ